MIMTVIMEVIMRVIMTMKTASNKKATVVTIIKNTAVRKIAMWVMRKKLMEVILAIMKIVTMDCQVHIRLIKN